MTSTSDTGTDLAVYEAAPAAPYGAQALMTPEAARELDAQLRMCTRAVLREGTDYGAIPGTDGTKVLFRPGAQKLLQWFGLSFTCERTDLERDGEGRKHGITYRAVITRRGTGEILATCEGTADYDEDKFYQSAETVQRKAEAKERYYAEKDRRVANPTKWKNLPEYRAPWNTLVKRAQKRAIVGAAIDATAAGGIFAADDETPAAPADGAPSFYQRALGQASAVRTKEEGRQLWAAAAQAVLDGECTPGQATHIQNRIDQRIRQIGDAVPVDVEDLAEAAAAGTRRRQTVRSDAEDVPPAHAAAPPAAPAAPVAQGAGGTAGNRSPQDTPGTATAGDGGQLTALWTILNTAFGFSTDEKDQARAVVEHIVKHKLTGATTASLSYSEAKTVLDTLARWQHQAAEKGEEPRDYLISVMVAQDAAGGGDSDGQ